MSTVISKQVGLFSPPGVILPFGGTTAPDGWLLCDGLAVSRTTYAELFGAIGENWGEGDGSTTFNLPDGQGRFLRGVDNGAGRDPDAGSRTQSATGGNTGDSVGSLQGDEFASHDHEYSRVNLSGGSSDGFVRDNSFAGQQNETQNIFDRGGNETRPKNANVNYIIKT